MSAPVTAQRMSPPPGSGYPQAPARQGQPSQTEQAQAASAKVVNAYAEAIVKSLYAMFVKETQTCEAQGLSGKDVTESTLRFADGSERIVKTRYQKVHTENADPEIERKIGVLNNGNRKILQSIATRIEALLTPQAAVQLILIQAHSTKNPSTQDVEATKLHHSLVLKTYEYAGFLKIPDAHKTIILNGLQ